MNSIVPIGQRQLAKVFSYPLPKYFTWDEVKGILSANRHDLGNHAFINTLWKTGARISEAIQLRRTDLDPYAGTLRIATLKTGLKNKPYAGVGRKSKGQKSSRVAERILSIPEDLVMELSSRLLTCKDELIFPFSRSTGWRIVKEACENAGIFDERAHPHAFRHSYAVHLLRQGVPITALKDMLGHSNIWNTMIYLRITQPDIRAILAQVQW